MPDEVRHLKRAGHDFLAIQESVRRCINLQALGPEISKTLKLGSIPVTDVLTRLRWSLPRPSSYLTQLCGSLQAKSSRVIEAKFGDVVRLPKGARVK